MVKSCCIILYFTYLYYIFINILISIFTGMSSQPFDQMLMQAQSFNQISSNDGIRQQIIDTIVDATCDGEI